MREARDVILESKYSRLLFIAIRSTTSKASSTFATCFSPGLTATKTTRLRHSFGRSILFPKRNPSPSCSKRCRKRTRNSRWSSTSTAASAGSSLSKTFLKRSSARSKTKISPAKSWKRLSKTDEGSYDVVGSTEIGKIERLFDMEIEADDFTTIAGLVINESGKVPAVGERINVRGLEVEVLEADERRISRLRIKKAQAQNASEVSAN